MRVLGVMSAKLAIATPPLNAVSSPSDIVKVTSSLFSSFPSDPCVVRESVAEVAIPPTTIAPVLLRVQFVPVTSMLRVVAVAKGNGR